MNLTTFINLSPSEFLQLNQDNIPVELIKYLEDCQLKIDELQEEIDAQQNYEDSGWDQVHSASNLLKRLDQFAESNLLKEHLEMYNQIRENTDFEV